ncbi:uncharacterized protein MYCFIDRAFT_212063 [Pseudocercospora fijiensis CIRAD86]|uniref:DUF6923 domain-containing protein n=1 Tax=Pseudocercospora fijiensis (strain CIRAD86) TaxID=383855 RepID=M3ASI9_PSEFD|nr:uncharacterized protein MYCFIDRAFT_212063 [Pseudocercospora fijiensis CIRAD86]EME80467.1 hypothetical protein MYCFIDRAFT_212063 [Pseudocercospora fijiensis CIRAD86]
MYTAPCVVEGYLSQRNTLYRVNLATGQNSTVYTSTDSGTNDGINSLALNPLDSYLYATIRGVDPEVMVRVSFDGRLQRLFNLPSGRKFYVGDFTPDGSFWTGSQSNGWQWIKVNFAPGTANYSTVVQTGTASLPASPFNTNNGGIQDWAYVPGAGQNLFAPFSDSTGATTLYSFSLSTLSWATVGNVGAFGTTVANAKWNAVWASNDGFLYGSEGNTGQIWKFTIRNGIGSQFIVTGPPSQLADGARCWSNTTAIGA